VSDASDYTILVHGEQRGLPHVELEIRQDLLASDSDVQSWAERLSSVLEEAVRHVVPT
jgi:predicted N-formylglutamate amidohydrolase